ncbi:MAG: ABC transporter permease [Desulfobacteraceae bacterium]|nr:MAG: ABC transporter permease [Desulfobacteraceae bacterium]
MQTSIEPTITIIKPKPGWVPIHFSELWSYRELLYFLVVRDLKVRYKQTVLGGLWAIIQPLFTMLVFTFFFGKLAKIPSDGIPYPIFVYAGLLPWTYFSNALSNSGNSLVGNANLIAKVYFPRLLIPGSAVLSALMDFAVSFLVLAGLLIYYRIAPGPEMALVPVLILLTVFCALGVGLWLSALNAQYRDIRYAIPFLIQIWLFVSPVIYPISLVAPKWQWLLALNPMGGIITAFRAALLGHQPIDWFLLHISALTTLFFLGSGLFYFRRTEKTFADII